VITQDCRLVLDRLASFAYHHVLDFSNSALTSKFPGTTLGWAAPTALTPSLHSATKKLAILRAGITREPVENKVIRKIDHVSRYFKLKFSFAPGSTFGLLEPNGAGKSTLMKMPTTLLPPSEGTATIAGFDLAKHPENVLRKIESKGQSSIWGFAPIRKKSE
jgi:ABC-type glutathione transport system ATPase component